MLKSEKIIKFLQSINLNPDDFDLEIDAIFRDNFDPKIWVIKIVKETPWNYISLTKFLLALKNIKYKYEMSFSYKKNMIFSEIKNFFNCYCLDYYHFLFSGQVILEKQNILSFVLDKNNEKEKIIIDNFKKIVDFFCLGFNVILKINNDEIKKQEKNENNLKLKINNEVLTVNSKIEDKTKQEQKNKEEEIKKEKKYQIYNDFFEIPRDKNIFVDITGEIFDIRIVNNNDKKVIIGGIGNIKSAINFKIEIKDEKLFKQVEKKIKIQSEDSHLFPCLRLKGSSYFDKKNKEMFVLVHEFDFLPLTLREDNASKKRVELHLHTNMSQTDGITSIADYIKLAKNMGHKAIALTDHGVIQAFPYAQAAAKNDIKVIYGCEFYMADKKLNYTFNSSNVLLKDAVYVCLDLETTGLSTKYDRVIEIGAVKIQNGLNIGEFNSLINPGFKLSDFTKKMTQINDEMLEKAPSFDQIWPNVKKFIGDAIIVTHNTLFDVSFLDSELKRMSLDKITNPVIDTLSLSRYLFNDFKLHNLGSLSRRLELNDVYDEDKAHRANFDAEVLSRIWCILLDHFLKENSKILHSDLTKLPVTDEIFKNLYPHHVIVLAKNAVGLKDLFSLITKSHTVYLAEIPKIPREEIEKLRKNFLIGSACLNGEIFEIAYTRDKETLKNAMKFYDYIEIQPLSCYQTLLHKCKYLKIDKETGKRQAVANPLLKDEEAIRQTVEDIIVAANELNIPICATGDVHYLNKEDKIFREIYIATDGINHRAHPLCTNPRGNVENHKYYLSADQYYRNTEEMLEEFKYLTDAEAKKIVIDNPNKIADMCEMVYPIKDKLYTPHIENADEKLKELTYKRAQETYGEILPDSIKTRLNTELSRIIGDKESYSVNYLLAMDIVKKANDDGFFVGSRGSVGSSLVANLLGITEVNPLSPHYLCPKCKKIIWSQDIKYISGIDLPNKKCPNCCEIMLHDGQNIPFETFLGIDEKNTKIPDIDLNFAGSYQLRAHNYLRDKFGRNHVFRAGTVGAYKIKMALTCVKDYFERSLHKEISKISKIYQRYLASKCVGVKKTTGQHPGGIILIPKEFDVHDFTPVQYPADNIDSDWETTHFEISTIHDTVLKLDLLGHLDPLALKMMGELANVDFVKIPLNDPKVLSLFNSYKVLGLKENYLKFKTGTMGLPEFGTDFVQSVLINAKPKTFNDLLVISGITHGTDVWVNNVDELLKSGKTLNEIIGCRDDIMTYLIEKGMSKPISFQIMEDVRKGKGLTTENINLMRNNNIPDYYINSCNKIKYLFPRAHATAYVIQAVRVGYFKVYYPLVFYAVYFSIRSDQYDIDSMIKGLDGIKKKLEFLKEKNKKQKLSAKENAVIEMLKMALEMNERGFYFANIDINKSQAKEFVIDNEHKCLIPPFIVIDGLGDAAAESIIEARKNKLFESAEDFRNRTSVIKKNFEKMESMGVFSNMQKQLTLEI